MRYHEIMEKSEPNNPQLWGRAKAEASKRYKKHSAYKMGWASKWYKEKGGTWKTVSETVDDMINEITRPEFRNDAVELLQSKGYEQLGSGKFANVFLRKSRPNEVIKLFGTNDEAYESYIDFIMKHQDNPHFPKVIGKPMLITPDYYAVKLERLEHYDVKKEGILLQRQISAYVEDDRHISDFKDYLDAFPKFKEALDLLKEFNDEASYEYDIHSGNIMWRGRTLVLTDPLYDPETMEEGYGRSEISENLRNWFDEKWVDISRKENGKHPECGASAGKGRRKKSSKAAYPKCVKKSKADSMTKKEKESASRRKRDTERKSSGSKINMVKTDT
jgi:hypothetical protein